MSKGISFTVQRSTVHVILNSLIHATAPAQGLIAIMTLIVLSDVRQLKVFSEIYIKKVCQYHL